VANDSSNPRDVSGFDLRDLPADFYDNPFPYYAALQADSPIKRLPDGAFILTRYSDVEFAYKNPKIFSSDKMREFGDKFGATPLFEWESHDSRRRPRLDALLSDFPSYSLSSPPTRGGRASFRGFLRVPCELNGGKAHAR
jgi:cytochrome P450